MSFDHATKMTKYYYHRRKITRGMLHQVWRRNGSHKWVTKATLSQWALIKYLPGSGGRQIPQLSLTLGFNLLLIEFEWHFILLEEANPSRYRVLFFPSWLFLTVPSHFQYRNDKNLLSQRGAFFTLNILWKSCSGWLQLVFNFGTEKREEQLNKAPCTFLPVSVYTVKIEIETALTEI